MNTATAHRVLTTTLRLAQTRARGMAGDERGQVTVFVVVIATAVLLFAGLVLDGGLALSAKTRALGQAQEAARAGAQALDLTAYRADGRVRLVPDQARQLALDYLSAAGATGTVTADGSTVTVTVTATESTQLLLLVGVDTIQVSSTGSAQPARGVTAPDP
jgi:Flp pilus assembly protein TadG